MDLATLKITAAQMIAPGKGILAIDESTGTCQKRFDSVGVECTEEIRRQYRQLLITAPGIEKAIGGMILFDETFWQKTDDGTPFPQALKAKGIVPGIKVDTGAKDMTDHPGEKNTSGLDGLAERLKKYRENGAGFAKWRSVITIDIEKGLPSDASIEANAEGLAKYAKLCQEADIVPIVEPEVLIDGNHTLQQCEEVTEKTLTIVFGELQKEGVALEGIILKPSMVISGKDCENQATAKEVAEATVRVLKKCVPAEVPGIAFLSGGQSDIQATEHLNEMNAKYELPWRLTFSYGRAIQQPALHFWAEDIENNISGAQEKLVHRAKMNGAASNGEYKSEMEQKFTS